MIIGDLCQDPDSITRTFLEQFVVVSHIRTQAGPRAGCDPDYGWLPGAAGTDKCYMLIKSDSRCTYTLYRFQYGCWPSHMTNIADMTVVSVEKRVQNVGHNVTWVPKKWLGEQTKLLNSRNQRKISHLVS